MPDVQEQGMHGYFQRELDYLRTRAKEFSKDYPRVAEELALSQGKSSDPHIELLLQSFAYLSGRIRQDLDSEACHIPNQLLGILYPHLNAPIPSMLVAQADIIADGANFEGGWTLEKGREFYANASGTKGSQVRCNFRNCYETTLRPIEISEADFVPVNQYQFTKESKEALKAKQAFANAQSILRVRVKNTGADPVHSYGLDDLSIYINGEERSAFDLYSMLSDDLCDIAILNYENGDGTDDAGEESHKAKEPHVQILAKDKLVWSGFDEEQAVLPYKQSSHQAYRVLQEYFLFPEKYLFFHIEDIESDKINRDFEILFLFKSANKNSASVNKESLRLNCMPLINLFKQNLNPIRLDHRQHEYRLIGESHQHAYCEVHSVIDVHAVPESGQAVRLSPYIGLDENLIDDASYYYSTRLEVSPLRSVHGTESYMAFHDANLDLNDKSDQVITVDAWCTNRRLPEFLRSGDHLTISGSGPIKFAKLLCKPSRHRAPKLNGKQPWRLVSNMSLNYLSLTADKDGLESLKSILLLYCNDLSPSQLSQINSLVRLKNKRVVKRVGEDAWRGFCKGNELTLEIDENIFDGGSALMFGEVIRRFFALYANVNSFTQMVLESKQRKGEWKRWDPLAGEQIVL